MIGFARLALRVDIAGKRIGNARRVKSPEYVFQYSAREQAQDHFHTDCFGGGAFLTRKSITVNC